MKITNSITVLRLKLCSLQ